MVDSNISNISVEFNYREAMLIRKAIMSMLPAKEDEMIVMMLYARITRLIEEKFGRLRE